MKLTEETKNNRSIRKSIIFQFGEKSAEKSVTSFRSPESCESLKATNLLLKSPGENVAVKWNIVKDLNAQ